MKKIVLVDGNNLLFRSYYATAYTGNIMRNKEGFPTNGVYGFVNMINKIISEEKLLKTKVYIWMDKKTFNDTYGFDPIHMIDLKALMGDSSDNIPGVKGIGEKGAIKLVSEYKTIDNIYENIDKIKGATQIKLIDGKEDAYYSKDLVTIYREVPLDITFDDLLYKGENADELIDIYNDLGFYSLLRKINTSDIKKEKSREEKFKIISDINDVKICEDTSIYLDTTIGNYHDAEILGIALYNSTLSYYIPYDIFKNNTNILDTDYNLSTYDYKKLIGDLEIRKVIIDPSATSLINLFKQNKIAVKEADNADIDGKNLVLNRLDEERIHIVEEKCPNIIREFNSYIWDEKAQEKGEDKPVKQNDHALDALRYLLQTLYPNKKRGAYFVQ